jgi:hypothetical protein
MDYRTIKCIWKKKNRKMSFLKDLKKYHKFGGLKIMEGLERLETEVLEMNNYNISAIFEYLKTRTDLYENFNNEEKSIKQMYEFIYEKAKKQKQDNVAMINDRVVYLWAITYFNKSNKELGIQEKKAMPPKPAEVLKKENEKKPKKEEKKPEDNQITLFQEVQK